MITVSDTEETRLENRISELFQLQWFTLAFVGLVGAHAAVKPGSYVMLVLAAIGVLMAIRSRWFV